MNKFSKNCKEENKMINEPECKCPLGGDEANDCADCAYSCDYHFVDGECVRRKEETK